MSDQSPADAGTTEPVNRSRRSKFIFWVVGFCLLSAFVLTTMAGFNIIAPEIALLTTFVQSVLSLAGLATVSYVGGSSIDYNGGLGNMFARNQSAASKPPPPTAARQDPKQGDLFAGQNKDGSSG